jgi:hypothetical protein
MAHEQISKGCKTHATWGGDRPPESKSLEVNDLAENRRVKKPIVANMYIQQRKDRFNKCTACVSDSCIPTQLRNAQPRASSRLTKELAREKSEQGCRRECEFAKGRVQFGDHLSAGFKEIQWVVDGSLGGRH